MAIRAQITNIEWDPINPDTSEVEIALAVVHCDLDFEAVQQLLLNNVVFDLIPAEDLLDRG